MAATSTIISSIITNGSSTVSSFYLIQGSVNLPTTSDSYVNTTQSRGLKSAIVVAATGFISSVISSGSQLGALLIGSVNVNENFGSTGPLQIAETEEMTVLGYKGI